MLAVPIFPMRQLNLIGIFALCFAFGMFSIRNADPVSLELLPGFELEAPLSLELFLAMSVGVVLAWAIGLWGGIQNVFARFKSSQQLKQRDKRIAELEATLSQIQGQLLEQQNLTEQQQQAMVAYGDARAGGAIAELPEGRDGDTDETNNDIQEAEFEEPTQTSNSVAKDQ